VHGPEDLLVDLALDSARSSPCSIATRLATTSTRVGPTVHQEPLLALAREVHCGFDIGVFTDMLRHLARYGDVDLALGDVDITALRAFFQQLITELHPTEH
jgi:hypothetical protein